MRSGLCLAGIFVAVAAVTGALAGPAEGPSPSIPARQGVADPPLPGGPAPDLDLVFTAQVDGYVEPCG